MAWKTVGIVGVGLLGASIGLALRARRLAEHVIGIARRRAALDEAAMLGAITEGTTDLARGVAQAELVVVCTPVDLIAEQVLEAARHCPAGALLTDVGSTKQHLVEHIERAWAGNAGVAFVGSHPLAGSEKTGPQAGRANLFEGRLVLVTPGASTPADAVARVRTFWEALGARTALQTPAEHDRILAATSHVPHVVAAALALATEPEELACTAGGWADTTRIAAGDPQLWKQILCDNRGHVLRSLDKFAKVLADFRAALAEDDHEQLVRLLAAGKQRRDALGS